MGTREETDSKTAASSLMAKQIKRMMDTASGLLRRINHGLYGKYLVGDVPNAGDCQVGYYRPFIVGLMYIF